MKATAVAHPNIALIKYWGKRDEERILPANGSLSMTLDGLCATTTVEFGARSEDSAQLDGRRMEGGGLSRIVKVLDLVRVKAGIDARARVVSKTNFPKATGLASSSAGGAAIAMAASRAAGLDLDPRELSILARRGSGSACRSVMGGFCEWLPGKAEDGSDSFATQVAPPEHWPELRMVAIVCEDEPKRVSSTEGMRRTAATSPYFEAWTRTADSDLESAREALLRRDLGALGAIAERNSWRMHAAALAADPPLCYLKPRTLEIIELIEGLRAGGLQLFFTLDAGANPVLLCLASAVPRVEMRLGSFGADLKAVAACPGSGVQAIDRHLF